MALPFLDGPVIRAGQSLSEPMDCAGWWILRLVMPDDWDRAPLTFQVSPDGDEYR